MEFSNILTSKNGYWRNGMSKNRCFFALFMAFRDFSKYFGVFLFIFDEKLSQFSFSDPHQVQANFNLSNFVGSEYKRIFMVIKYVEIPHNSTPTYVKLWSRKGREKEREKQNNNSQFF